MEAVGGFDIRELAGLFLILAGLAIVLAALLLAGIFWRVRRIRLPVDADFFTALRYTPFAVVVMLDLLDFGLDFLSAPIAWAILGRLGLEPLRGVTVVEELIPGTQFLPTMTAAWVLARVLGPRLRL
jgi:hypothetical protein